MDWVVPVGALVLGWIMGLLLARHNLKILRETKQERLEARRAFKKKKNRALAKYYGIKLPDDK